MCFKDSISFYTDASNNPHHLCLLVYRMPKGFTPIIKSHGNSKDNRPFLPTWPNTLSRVKDERVLKQLLSVFQRRWVEFWVHQDQGKIPRNEKQVSNAKKKHLKSDGSATADELFVVMQRAISQDPLKKFIRDVKTAPEPAV